MPTPSIFSLIRQGIAYAKFDSSDTRTVVTGAIDALETANNNLIGPDLEDEPEVILAVNDLTNHLVELLGNPITTSKEVAIKQASREEEDEFSDDSIETD
jgi:hypothetical protein